MRHNSSFILLKKKYLKIIEIKQMQNSRNEVISGERNFQQIEISSQFSSDRKTSILNLVWLDANIEN